MLVAKLEVIPDFRHVVFGRALFRRINVNGDEVFLRAVLHPRLAADRRNPLLRTLPGIGDKTLYLGDFLLFPGEIGALFLQQFQKPFRASVGDIFPDFAQGCSRLFERGDDIEQEKLVDGIIALAVFPHDFRPQNAHFVVVKKRVLADAAKPGKFACGKINL